MTRGRRRLAAVATVVSLILCLLGAAALASTAGAQDDQPLLLLRSLDSRDAGAVELDLVYTGDASDVEQLTLTEDGTEVDDVEVGPRPDGDPPQDIVFVVDTSVPMVEGEALADATEALGEWIDAAPSSTRFSVVEAGAEPTMLQSLSTSKRLARDALRRLEPSGSDTGATWGALRLAAAGLRDTTAGNVVVLTGSTDLATNPRSRAAARGTMESSGAPLWVAAFTGEGYQPGAWAALVGEVGGEVRTAAEGAEVAALVGSYRDIVTDSQYRVVFPSATAEQLDAQIAAAAEDEEQGRFVEGEGPSADLAVTIGDQTVEALLLPGGVAVGQPALNPERAEPGGGIGFLQGSLGLILTILVVLAAAGLLAFAVVSIIVRDDGLSATLRPYDEVLNPGFESPVDGKQTRPAIVTRAAEMAEEMAERRGYLARVEQALEQANIPLRAGEAMSIYAIAVLGMTVIGLLLFRNLIGGLLLGIFVAVIPAATLNIMAALRRKKFMGQLPDMLQLLSGTLRAGYSLMQGIEAVSQEVEDPMGIELRRAVTEARLGRPVEEALEQVGERMGSEDFAWAVMAIRIQREVGGNLAELLMTVSDTMVARERLRRDVASLTAEGRVSAMVLGAMPPILGVVMWSMNPDYIATLFQESLGIILVVVALVSMGIGFAWMRKIITIEI